jgi:hypothetical protein
MDQPRDPPLGPIAWLPFRNLQFIYNAIANMGDVLALFLAGAAAIMPQIPLEKSQAIQALNNWSSDCQKDGQLLWGKSLCGPMVLVDPSTRSAITNGPDPGGTFRRDGSSYIGVLPEQFTPSNTSIHWAQQNWAMVMLPLPHDPFLRLALVAHESFHRIQPALGLSGSDAPDPALDTEIGRLWMRMELRALARALRSDGALGRQSAMDAMLFRTYRDELCPGTERMEAAMEKQEGLAEYTGVFIALRETGENISREARIVEALEDSDAFARSFGYAVGPALGLLLDRYAPAWREQIARAASLDSLLTSALKVQLPEDLQHVARARAALYGYRAVVLSERERDDRHQALLTELKSKFLQGSTLDFPTAPEMTRNFNPQTLVPFPPYGTFYPTGTFAANWGKLQVESGGALLAPDNRSLRVPPPLDPNARPIRGAGWICT